MPRLLPLGLAAAAGYLAAAYCVQLAQLGRVGLGDDSGPVARLLSALFLPPTRGGWAVTWAVATLLLVPAAAVWHRGFAAARWAALPHGERRVSALLAAGWAAAVLRWWEFGLADNLWLLPGGLRGAAEAGRVTAGVAVAGAAAWTLLTLGVVPAGEDRPAAPPPGWFRWRAAMVGWGLFLAAAVPFAVWYVRAERTVYFWDYGRDWTGTNALAAEAGRDPAGAFDRVRESVKYGDYNLLGAVPAAAAAVGFGTHRLVFVLATVAGYGLAIAVAASAAVRVVGRHWPGGPSWAAGLAPLAALFGLPLLWASALRGMFDTGGVALGLGVLAVYLSRPAGRLGWPRVVAVAGLLLALSLFRRWYNFWVAAFLLTAGVETVLAAATALRAGGWRAAVDRCRGPAGMVVLFLAGWLSFAWPMFRTAATTDYAAAYVGYKTDRPFAVRLGEVPTSVGLGAVAVAAAGLGVLLADPRTRRAGVVAGVMLPVAAVHFHRTQDPGFHHFGLYLPGLVLGVTAGLTRAVLAAPAGWPRAGLIVAAVGLGGLASAVVFVPALEPLRGAADPVAARVSVPPLVRGDLPELERLLAALDAHTAGGRSFAVVASSPTFNQTTLMVAGASLRRPFPAVPRLVWYAEVDRVNGFPAAALTADLLVVADPPQTHLRPDQQVAVAEAARELLAGTGLGAGFTRLPDTFRLDDGVTVSLFRRDRRATAAEVAGLAAALRAAHPGLPRTYTPPADW